ncbi:PREDICTED: auxilin-related protein 1-like [Nicotiana attenuata]|uniref:Auxilin-related protein 2 n=1 Tax=Nicotiana attenuata TaxID=49451 RepID=A0A314LDY5_NICAT|nr:PREDICTED: auxilin-related protein 1-like [Nicotiana attenuata]OIT39763.1 auxilin-related protein 2 [Nicotiana attenuata]
MDDLDVLARDFGFKPAGKSAPMRSDGGDRRSSSVRSSNSSPLFDDPDSLLYKDVFTKSSNNNSKYSSMSDFNYDSIFKSDSNSSSNNNNNNNSNKTSSLPVYDKPVYDEDIFDGLPGLKSKSVTEKSASAVRFDDDVFAKMTSPPQQKHKDEHFGDLLGNLKGNEKKVTEPKNSTSSSSARGFDDLLAGFGSSSTSTTNKRSFTESSQYSKPAGNPNQNSSVLDDPFEGLGSTSMAALSSPGEFMDPLEEIGHQLGKSGNAKSEASSVSGGGLDDLDPLNGFSKSVPPFYPARNDRGTEGSPQSAGSGRSDTQTSTSRENIGKSSSRFSGSRSQKKVPGDSFQDSPLFDMPSADPRRSFGQAASPPYASSNIHERNFESDTSPRSEEPSDVVWLSVSEIPLFTQPTRAPPPSRPPPPIPRRNIKSDSNARKKGDRYSSSPSYNQYSETPKLARPAAKSPPISQLDELDEFAMGRSPHSVDEGADIHSGEDMSANSVAAASAAAMKEAMDRAQAKFRHAKEVREREYAKAAKSKEAVNLDNEEQAVHEMQEKELRENKERLEREHQQRVKEEEERAQQKLEKERERAREMERDRGRQAVERATREARERAAAEARERASADARLKTERAAVEKAAAEARERAERAAVQRAQAEARERAAAEARDRAQKAAAEAREKEAREKASAAKAEAEARRRAERAAVERAAAEARERAAAEARERAAAARMNQQKNDDDLESFFNLGSRANSAPKTRTSSSETSFASQFQNKAGPEGPKATFSSTTTSSNRTKASSSTTSFVDDLSSIFGAATSSGDFQDVEGETEERRRARLERHQRTQERAAKALAEKNQRDLQVQREQEERHRIGETLDFEIKRWAAGKEGNLRALLSTLQYVLWPECGWQPVSLTDLITGASVKKVYRKATLCIHPDKVQQKGATLQQKYIAEKVFDMLKEAWNKFNSEELF